MQNSIVRLYVFFLFVILHSSFCISSDWPQLQYDAQRSGHAPETSIKMPDGRPDNLPWYNWGWCEFVVGWVRDFMEFDPPQHVSRVTQIIAYGDKLFVPTMEGRLYALDPATGAMLWVFDGGEGVMHTAGAAEGRVFFATIDGSVFAVDAGTGKQVWHWRSGQRAGFSCAVLLADGKIFVGSRSGRMHALSQADGSEVWRYEVNAPIYQSAACNEGRVYVAAEDMRAYCWDAADGKLLWKSVELNGMSFRDYYPLVHGGKVFFEAQSAWGHKDNGVIPAFGTIDGWFPLSSIFSHEKEFAPWLERHGQAMAEGKPDDDALRDILEAQQRQAAMFDQFPRENIRHVLDEKTGQESVRLPLFIQTMSGNQPPPVVDRDGMLIMPAAFYNNRYARFDLRRNQYIDMLMGVGQFVVGGGYETMAKGGNGDEGNNVSSAGSLIFITHSLESISISSGQGVYCLDKRRWGLLQSIARERDASVGVDCANTQCGGNAASIAYGAAYHHVYGRVHNWIPNTGK